MQKGLKECVKKTDISPETGSCCLLKTIVEQMLMTKVQCIFSKADTCLCRLKILLPILSINLFFDKFYLLKLFINSRNCFSFNKGFNYSFVTFLKKSKIMIYLLHRNCTGSKTRLGSPMDESGRHKFIQIYAKILNFAIRKYGLSKYI